MSAESEWKHQYTTSDNINHHRQQNLSISNDFLIHAHYRPMDKFNDILKNASLIVEHGCGTGEFVANLAHKLPHVRFVGMDFSQEAINLAVDYKNQLGNIDYLVHDMKNTEFPYSGADICIVSNVIEHFDNWTTSVESLLKCYKHLLIIVPFEERIDQQKGDKPEDGAGGHFTSFNRNSFLRFQVLQDMVFFSLQGWGVSHAGECPLQYAVLLRGNVDV